MHRPTLEQQVQCSPAGFLNPTEGEQTDLTLRQKVWMHY